MIVKMRNNALTYGNLILLMPTKVQNETMYVFGVS